MEITCRVYRPRDPRKTPLYGLLESLYERVKGAWEERFERSYGFWRVLVDEVVEPVGHAQWVFTMPKRLRVYFRHHPHVHAFCSRGGWTARGEWVPWPYVDEAAAEKLFRHKLLGLLRRSGRVASPA